MPDPDKLIEAIADMIRRLREPMFGALDVPEHIVLDRARHIALYVICEYEDQGDNNNDQGQAQGERPS